MRKTLSLVFALFLALSVLSSSFAFEDVIYSSTPLEITDDSGSVIYTEQHVLELLDETRGAYSYVTDYTDGSATSIVYAGTYVATDTGYVLTFSRPDGDDLYTVTMQDGAIVSVEYGYHSNEVLPLSGTYTFELAPWGTLTLDVTDDGAFVTTADGTQITANCSVLDETHTDLMFMAPDESDWYDLVVTANGDKLDAMTYTAYTYGPYAGVYPCVGDLGDIVITVAEDGTASCDFEAFGKQISVTGFPSVNLETNEVIGFYLYSDEGYSLDIYVEDNVAEGKLNYSGSLTVYLAAG